MDFAREASAFEAVGAATGMDSLAARTRDAVRDHPALVVALRAGVLNHAAAARFLDVEGEEEAVATALRRFAEELPDYDPEERDARVTMESGVGLADGGEDALLAVGGVRLVPGEGSLTAVVATGDVDAAALSAVLARLALAGVDPRAAGVADGTLALAVERREGARALRETEAALDAVERVSEL